MLTGHLSVDNDPLSTAAERAVFSSRPTFGRRITPPVIARPPLTDAERPGTKPVKITQDWGLHLGEHAMWYQREYPDGSRSERTLWIGNDEIGLLVP